MPDLIELPDELLELVAAPLSLRDAAALRAAVSHTHSLSLQAWAHAHPSVVLAALSDPRVPAGVAGVLARTAVDVGAVAVGPGPRVAASTRRQTIERARLESLETFLLAPASAVRSAESELIRGQVRPPEYAINSVEIWPTSDRLFSRDLFAGAAEADASEACARVDFENAAVVAFLLREQCRLELDDDSYFDAVASALWQTNLPLLEYLAAARTGSSHVIRSYLAYVGKFEQPALARVLELAQMPKLGDLAVEIRRNLLPSRNNGGFPNSYMFVEIVACVIVSVIYCDNGRAFEEIFGAPEVLDTIPLFWEWVSGYCRYWPQLGQPSRVATRLLQRPSVHAIFRSTNYLVFHLWAEPSAALLDALFSDQKSFWSRCDSVIGRAVSTAWYQQAIARWPAVSAACLVHVRRLFMQEPLKAAAVCRALGISPQACIVGQNNAIRLAHFSHAGLVAFFDMIPDPTALRELVREARWSMLDVGASFVELLSRLQLAVADLRRSPLSDYSTPNNSGARKRFLVACRALEISRTNFPPRVLVQAFLGLCSPPEPFGLVWFLRDIAVQLADLGLDAVSPDCPAEHAPACARRIRWGLAARLPPLDAGLERLFADAGADAGAPFLTAATAASPAVFAQVLAKTQSPAALAGALKAALAAGRLEAARAIGERAARVGALDSRQYCRLFRRLVGRQDAAALRVLVETWRPPPAPVLAIAYAIARKIAYGATRQLVAELRAAHKLAEAAAE